MSVRRRRNDLAPEQPSEVDETARIELWNAWRLAQLESGFALDAWYEASKGDKARAHAVYSAALEREGRAADALARPHLNCPGPGVDEALAA